MILPLADKGFFNWMPDKKYLQFAYRLYMDNRLDLDHPQTFNEKLQWLKLYDRNPLYTKMVDKYEAKGYVASVIGSEYIIPTTGLWESVDDIDPDILPDQFVLKCTHDSGSIILCKDKSQFDWEGAKKTLRNHLRKNIYWFGREWPYKNVKPRIIAEPYLEDPQNGELRDYKFFCFDGEVKCFKIDFDRFTDHKANYYSKEKELLRIGEVICPPDFSKTLEMPEELSAMITLAEKLSSSIPFLRTDFYDVNGRIYFGELTFFPASGFGPFAFKDNDKLLGSWIRLPARPSECV